MVHWWRVPVQTGFGAWISEAVLDSFRVRIAWCGIFCWWRVLWWPLAACFHTCKAYQWDVGYEHPISAAFVFLRVMSDISWTMASGQTLVHMWEGSGCTNSLCKGEALSEVSLESTEAVCPLSKPCMWFLHYVQTHSVPLFIALCK